METQKIRYLKCRISSDYINSSTGSTLSWYGHQFKIEPGFTTAFCDIPETIAREEARLGRYEIVEDAPAIEVEVKDDKFPGLSKAAVSIGNYYGCGDLENFRRKLVGMDRNQIVAFANETMNMNMDTRAYKPKLIDELCQIIETKIAEGVTETKE